jgi:uncharacterized protein YbjQ (UPF0145 family)
MRLFQIIVVFMIFCFLGCATQPKVPQAQVMRYTNEIFQPTSKCEVFHTKQIGRDYIEIGEVSVRLNKSTEENAIAYLNEKAKELGANAIIIIGERTRGAVAMPVGNMSVAIPIKDLYAIAIRYK